MMRDQASRYQKTVWGVAILLCLLFSFSSFVHAEESVRPSTTYPFSVKYGQTEARRLGKKLSDLCSGAVMYDYGMEGLAMKYAKEQIISKRQRPNGEDYGTILDYSMWWSILLVDPVCGPLDTVEKVYDHLTRDWEIEEDLAEGKYRYIGIGFVTYEGKYWWVTLLGSESIDLTETVPQDNEVIEEIEILDSYISSSKWIPSTEEISLNTGESTNLPTICRELLVGDEWIGRTVHTTEKSVGWESLDPSVAAVENGRLVGLGQGKTAIAAQHDSWAGTVDVTVSAPDAGSEEPEKEDNGGEEEHSLILGDLTGDGVVGMGDVVKLARAVAGTVSLTAAEEAAADVTGDGRIGMGDVVKLARIVAGRT